MTFRSNKYFHFQTMNDKCPYCHWFLRIYWMTIWRLPNMYISQKNHKTKLYSEWSPFFFHALCIPIHITQPTLSFSDDYYTNPHFTFQNMQVPVWGTCDLWEIHAIMQCSITKWHWRNIKSFWTINEKRTKKSV